MNELQLSEMEIESFPQDGTFRITDIESLNWTFRKLSAHQSKKAEIEALAQKEKERIERWEKVELKSINDSAEYFLGLVKNYHSQILAADPKVKTLSTPYGKSKTITSKPQPAVMEGKEEDLLNHILTNDMQDFVKKEVKWGDFKKTLSISEVDGVPMAFDKNGQAVAGVEIKPQSTSYSVEIVKG